VIHPTPAGIIKIPVTIDANQSLILVFRIMRPSHRMRARRA
jgi:hypothetical protein